MTNRLTVWIGIITSIVTIGLTVYNAVLNTKIEDAKVELGKAKFLLEEKAQELKVSEEKTDRLKFVQQLIPAIVASKNEKQGVLYVNLINLTLTPEEAGQFFYGLKSANHPELGKFADVGTKMRKDSRDHRGRALENEKEGYQRLIENDFEGAIKAFEAADEAYPTLHQVYEIQRFLKKQGNLNDPEEKKGVFREILKEYSAYASTAVRQKLKELAE